MISLIAALLTLAAALVLYVAFRLYRAKEAAKGLPGPEYHPIFGHIKIAAECLETFPPNAHPHAWYEWIRKKYSLGPIMFLDFSPMAMRHLVILDPELASRHVTVGNSLPKSTWMSDYLTKLLGKNNMVGADGPVWKMSRTMFQPGFNSGHLMTLVTYIVEMSEIFCVKLREMARTGETIEMEEFAMELTVDIIGKLVLDIDFDSQRANNPIVDAFRYQVATMPPAASPKNYLISLIDFPRHIRLWLNGRKLDRLIGAELDKRFANRTNASLVAGEASSKSRSRSIVDLALEAYQKEFQHSNQVKSNTIDPWFKQLAIDQIKTFIFAGNDTTSSTIAYTFYLLHKHPDKHARVAAELDHVFGSDRSLAPAMIKEDPYLINKLDYTTAVIKEVLRIFSPASTMRYCPETSKEMITDPATGISYPMAGWHVWPVTIAIHRNDAYFPRPTEFIPERFLPAENPFPDAKQHKDAWRPFEKGSRNCIGQELAMIESKVILALTLREFDFEHIPKKQATKEEEESRSIEGHQCYQVLKGSAKPVDGMPGRVLLR